ncbi:MAG: carboxyvinyl-carboxyphosphonate phosphorylmutase [bacterium TMED198]|nr:MAG: carboxyvinyl-carboxyphosphonate phosphorylmutase [bacterium TMED198]
MADSKLRRAIDSGETLVAPGVYDMISATIAEKVGFPAVFIGGYGVSASHLGVPDVGIMTFTDILERVRTFSAILTKPIIVDADTGYGGLVNLRHAVRGYEKAGVAAIQIEDQIFPKRCGHAKGVEVCDIQEMLKRIGVATESRNSENFLIIARTDSRLELGLEEAIKRAEAYSEAGADLIFVESPQTVDEMKILKQSIKTPLVFKMVPDGNLSDLNSKVLADLGFSILIYPTLGFLSAANAIQQAFNEFKRTGLVNKQTMQRFDEFSNMIGFEEIYSFEDRWDDQ